MKDLTKYEKYNRLISFIHEYKRLPRRNEETELYMIYSALQQSVTIANKNLELGRKIGPRTKENVEWYNQVMQTLRLYKPSKIEKLELLIDFIKTNHRLPTNNDKEQFLFKDNTNMRGFYDGFMAQVRSIKEKQKQEIPLQEKEQVYLEYAKKIEEELSKYQMTKEEKVNELIEFIKAHHRLPRAKQFNGGEAEVRYKDNTSMSIFQLSILSEAKRIEKKKDNGETLTSEEQEVLCFNTRIKDALKSSKTAFDEKVDELIKFVEENHRLPKFKYYNGEKSEKTFKDGTDMRNFYHILKQKTRKTERKKKNNELVTLEEEYELKCINKIQKIIASSQISREKKLELLLEFIRINHRLPRTKASNNKVVEVMYEDNTDMNKFYSSISNAGKLAIKKEKEGKPLTKKQEQNKRYYQKLCMTLSFYKKTKKLDKNGEMEKILNILEDLSSKNKYEEILLFYEIIIEDKNLSQESQANLKHAFERYITSTMKKDQEKEKIHILYKR